MALVLKTVSPLSIMSPVLGLIGAPPEVGLSENIVKVTATLSGILVEAKLPKKSVTLNLPLFYSDLKSCVLETSDNYHPFRRIALTNLMVRTLQVIAASRNGESVFYPYKTWPLSHSLGYGPATEEPPKEVVPAGNAAEASWKQAGLPMDSYKVYMKALCGILPGADKMAKDGETSGVMTVEEDGSVTEPGFATAVGTGVKKKTLADPLAKQKEKIGSLQAEAPSSGAAPAYPAGYSDHQFVSDDEMVSVPVMKLSQASKLYQPVKGTDSMSRYFLVAQGDGIKVAARMKSNGVLSVRAEGLKLKDYKALLSKCGLDSHDTYASAHFHCENIDNATRCLSAVLAPMAGVLTTPIPIGAKIAGKGK